MKYTTENVPFQKVVKYLDDRMYNVEDLDRDLLEEAREETAMTLNGESFIGGPFEFAHFPVKPLPDSGEDDDYPFKPGLVVMRKHGIPDDSEIPFDSPLLTKENSLYLTIRQKPFDEIIAGEKTKEYRDIKNTTFSNYLCTDDYGNPYLMESALPEEPSLDIYAYNDGVCPFKLRNDICFLRLKAGATAKDMDSAVVEVKAMTLTPGERFRYDKTHGVIIPNPDGKYCIWTVELHLGRVRSVYRKKR